MHPSVFKKHLKHPLKAPPTFSFPCHFDLGANFVKPSEYARIHSKTIIPVIIHKKKKSARNEQKF